MGDPPRLRWRCGGVTAAALVVMAYAALLTPSVALAAGDASQQPALAPDLAGSEPQMEPVDTEYAAYVLKSLGPFAGIDEGDYVPPPVSAVPGSPSGGSGLDVVSIPSSYDLRTTGKLTPIRSQSPYGTCWAFAACGSLESGLMPYYPLDVSEDHHALASGFFSAGSSASYLYNHGGNAYMSTAYLARWSGPVYESDQPYNTGYVIPGLVARRHVQDVDFLPARTGSLDNDTIKAAIMEKGAVETYMKWTSSAYKSSTRAFYYSGTCCANHAVDLVGWNDSYSASNFAARPPGNGAWIVRNSWGTSFGSGGYFYISYYDGVLARSGSFVVDTAEPVSNYGSVLQYDTLGRTASYGYGSTTAWLKNCFPVSSLSSLRAVAFYARTPGTSYEVHAGTGALTKVTAGTLDTAGYHTVVLPSAVIVPPGSTLSVAVKLTTPGSNYPIPVEAMYVGYSDQATSSAGESFVSSNGTSWYDMGSIGSVCLKAFIQPAVNDDAAPATTLSATPASDTAGWNHAPVSVSLNASDCGAGVRATYYRLNAGGTATYAGPFSISTQGTNTLTYWSVDWNNNAEASKTASFRLDTIAPVTTLHRTPAANSAGWTQGSVIVTLTASDAGSGLNGTYYRIGSGAATEYSVPLSFTTSGTTMLSYWTEDKAGNVESANTVGIKIDPSSPSVTVNAASRYDNVATVRAIGSDAISGIGRTDMSLDTTSAWRTTQQVSTSVLGTHTVFARVWDRAGNPSEVASATFKVVFVPKQTTKLYSPRLSKYRLRRGVRVRIKSRVRPSAASAHARSILYLYHLKSKIAYRKIGGRWKRVKVWYWKRTGKIYMARWRSGWVASTVRLRYRGLWKTYVVYPGSTGYEPCRSHTKRFRVR